MKAKGYRLPEDVHKALAELCTQYGSMTAAMQALLDVHSAKLLITNDVHTSKKLYFCTDCVKQLDFEVEERAAILEYDANMSLQDAERIAPMLTYQARILASSSAIS